MVKIAPSILSADFANLERDIQRISTADYVHVDVMDGMFVPNITIGIPVVKSIRPTTQLPLDVHLMIVEPVRYVEQFCDAGADWLTFHVECADDPERVLRAIEESGAKPGMALKPATPAEALYPYGERLHCVTVMTVEPGFGGQKLMEAPLEKIRQLKERFPHLVVEVDGGVNEETAPLVRQAGADLLVAGTAVFQAERPAEAMARLRGE